jgi:hypothetical protein
LQPRISCASNIFDYAIERVHVSALAVKMHGKNGANFSGRLASAPRHAIAVNERRIEIQRAGIDVHEDRGCARSNNRAG